MNHRYYTNITLEGDGKTFIFKGMLLKKEIAPRDDDEECEYIYSKYKIFSRDENDLYLGVREEVNRDKIIRCEQMILKIGTDEEINYFLKDIVQDAENEELIKYEYRC